MDSFADDSRWNTTRKKCTLSMKNRSQNNSGNVARSKNLLDKFLEKKNLLDSKALLCKHLTTDIPEFEDSENFSLRLSDSFVDNDINKLSREEKIEKPNGNDKSAKIIVISDSSDDDRADLIRPIKKKVVTPNVRFSDPESSMTSNSFDISEIRTDEEKKNTVSIRKDTDTGYMKNNKQKSSLWTFNDKGHKNPNNINDKENNGFYINAFTSNDSSISLKHEQRPRNTQVKQYHTSHEIIRKNISNFDDFKDANKHHGHLYSTPDSVSSPIRTTPLTIKDVRNIARVIKSKQVVYNSPVQTQRKKDTVNSNSEGSEDSNVSQEINDKRQVKHPVWIKETDSESSDTSPDGNQVSTKQIQTHVIDCNSAELSERKKEQISRWLLSNPTDSKSDTSISCVPLSEQNSISSGNSSLERLELNYETPNNRDRIRSKISNLNHDNKLRTVPTSTSQVYSDKKRQTTTDNNFLKKVGRGDKDNSYFTPISVMKTKKMVHSTLLSEDVSVIQVGDCANILDELYGDVWRKKAGDLFLISEPEKPNVKVQDRAVQTERKKIIRSKKKGSFPALDGNLNNEDSNKFMNKTKSELNSMKKFDVEDKKWRNSFINDSSSSDCSDGETTYLTALTTPRVSNSRDRENKGAPMSVLTMRAIEICDSDTENEDFIVSAKKIDDNKRRLSYSDDEIELESSPATSEYDPQDIILPKSVKQKIASPSKFSSNFSSSIEIGLTKSFLASLSPSVPLVNAHPDAKKYRVNYKNTKNELCKYLFKLYNDKIFCNKLPVDMLIEWNVRMRGTAGSCYNKTKKNALGTVERSSRIVLATKILDAPDRLRDTLVHEMCHAATWLINEVSDGHGPFWQAWASKAMKAFPELPSIKRCHDYKIATKYTYRCVSCGYSIGRHSKSLDVKRKRCGHCYGKFELLINKITKSGTMQVKTPSGRKATGFALFVKENYHLVKKERHGVRHKEIMQILGQQFSTLKISKDNNVDC